MNEKGDILIDQNSEGNIKIDVHLQEDSVWLSQTQLCDLFQKSKSTVSEYIKNVFWRVSSMKKQTKEGSQLVTDCNQLIKKY
jgi:hypothetical protein